MPAQDFLRRYLSAEIAVIGTAVAVVVLVLVLPGSAYPWIKAFHIIAVIAWMAGMLYLPRLFVYHCTAEKGSVQSETFKVMERRLSRHHQSGDDRDLGARALAGVARNLIPALDGLHRDGYWQSLPWCSLSPRCTGCSPAGSRHSAPTKTGILRGFTG